MKLWKVVQFQFCKVLTKATRTGRFKDVFFRVKINLFPILLSKAALISIAGITRLPVLEGEVSHVEIPRTSSSLGITIVGGADTPLVKGTFFLKTALKFSLGENSNPLDV